MSARTDSARQADDSPRREAILNAALDLFCERTFEGAAVPLIASNAGVSAGTIYHYFESKEALVNALYQHWKGHLKQMLADEAPRGAPAREEFQHWWRTLWRFASKYPRAFAFLETHHHAAYLDATSLAISDGLLDGARAFVRRGQRARTVRRGNPDVLIAMVLGAFTGLVKLTDGEGLDYSARAVADTEECAWRMISG